MSKLTDLIADILNLEEVDEGISMGTCPAWTSLAHIQLLSEIEALYDIALSADEAIAIDSLESILEVLDARGIDVNA